MGVNQNFDIVKKMSLDKKDPKNRKRFNNATSESWRDTTSHYAKCAQANSGDLGYSSVIRSSIVLGN